MIVSIVLIALIVAVGWCLLGLASYILFHPYVDTLMQKVVLGAIAFPALFAIFLPVLRNEEPLMIPAYFIFFAVFFAIVTLAVHFAEQWLFGSGVKKAT